MLAVLRVCLVKLLVICQSTAGKIEINLLEVLFCCLRLDVFIAPRGRVVMCAVVCIIAGPSMTKPQLPVAGPNLVSLNALEV